MGGYPKEAPYVTPDEYGVCGELVPAVPPSVREANSYSSIEEMREENPVLADQYFHLREILARASGMNPMLKDGMLPQEFDKWHEVFGTSREDCVREAQNALDLTSSLNAVKDGKPRKLTEFRHDPRDDAAWSAGFRNLDDAAFCNRSHPLVTALKKVQVFDPSVPLGFGKTASGSPEGAGPPAVSASAAAMDVDVHSQVSAKVSASFAKAHLCGVFRTGKGRSCR